MLNFSYKKLLKRHLPSLSKLLGSKAAKRLFSEAATFLVFALSRASMPKKQVATKCFRSLAFSIQQNCLGKQRGFAVPSKLVSVSNFQDRLIELHKSGETPQLTLTVSKVQAGKKRVVALHNGRTLGLIKMKHVPWMAPLVEHGASASVLQITGNPSQGHYCGCNIKITGVADAIRKL